MKTKLNRHVEEEHGDGVVLLRERLPLPPLLLLVAVVEGVMLAAMIVLLL
jgi:hypothetical protein